jgi:hypothetical protein
MTDRQIEFPKMPGLVIAYHGCEKEIAENVVIGKEQLRKSTNSYDWLGNGIYFWEGSKQRADEWAKQRARKPAVVGAIIDLGSCLNLVDTYCIEMVKRAYEDMLFNMQILGLSMPQNSNIKGNSDLLKRDLDCAVIQHLCKFLDDNAPDTVRGLFIEGNPLYENAGFRDKTHVQICVRNPDCIKGYFLPIS